MSDRALLLAFSEYSEPAKQLATLLDIKFAEIAVHQFPDGESKITLPEYLAESVIICQSLHHPNTKLVELFLAAGSARKRGVKQLILVAPYLCYMRQDKAFHPGEVVSQTIIGQLMANQFDAVITVDAHLHRVRNLSEAIPLAHAINLTATVPMAVFLKAQLENPLLLGPDSESGQWVAEIAAHDNLDYAVASKQRFSDRDVRVSLPAISFTGRHIVLVDDVASTGKTLLAVAEALQEHQPASINVLVNHALFVEDAIDQLKTVGVNHIWSCDSIPHTTNCISLAPLLSEEVSKLLR